MANVATAFSRRPVLAGLLGFFLVWFVPEHAIAEPQSFLIYFDKQSSQLTSPAKQIVGLLKGIIKPSTRVTITGNCDTSESEPDKLSLARATEVQKELAASGIPPGVTLAVSGKGTSQPRKATGPNVSEPTNRYVVITVN